MAHSFAQETGLTCPECGQSFTAQVWQIVDTAERPDLAARIHEGTLHDLPCPHCGHQGAVDAPLLLYRPDRDPPLLFSPAQGTTAEQDREQAAGLVGALRGRLGPAWQDEWVAEGLMGMPREFLPMALSEGPEAALRQMAERAQQEMERLREEDPERYRQLEEAARQAMEEAAPLLQAVQEFVEARTWAESHRVVEGHPELLTSEADGLLGRLVGTARAQGDENGVHVFEEHRALLRRCREVGIERAFAEETGGSVPKEMRPLLDALASLPMDQRDTLMELFASVDSPEALETALDAHPGLRAALEQALAQATSVTEEQVQDHPFYRLGRRVMNGDLTLEQALEEALAPSTLASLDGESINRMDDYLQTLLDDWQRAEECHVWAELNYAAAQALPASAHIRAFCANTLGNALSNRTPTSVEQHVVFLTRRIAVYREALQVWEATGEETRAAGVRNNLGVALSTRFEALGQVADLDAAIEAYHNALGVFTPDVFPDYTLTAALPLGRLLLARHRPMDLQQAVETYRQAHPAADYLYFESLHQSRRERQLRRTQGLTANYAYALARMESPRRAAEILEAGRARALAEALSGEQALARATDPAQRDVLEASWRRVKEAESAFHHADDARRARTEHLLAEARRSYYTTLHDVFPDFFATPTFTQVQEAIAGAPLVYLAATPAGGLALIVRSAGAEPLWLDGLTDEALRARLLGPADDPQLGGYLGAYFRWRRAPRDESAQAAWFTTLEETARWLWETAMGAVVEALAPATSHAILIPTGFLGLLPLHAAWTDDPVASTGRRYALDAIRFTYAPNGRAFGLARQRAAGVAPEGLLAVDEPEPVSGSHLPSSAWEVAAACDHFPSSAVRVLGGMAATRETVREALPDYPIAHMSCHGFADLAEPLQSGLVMAYDRVLTLQDLLDLRLETVRMVILSACETGLPGAQLPDEVIALPTGLTQAGVAGVVGTLWSVADLSTAMLVARFYDLWKGNGLEPAEALRQAQVWLRDATNAERAEYFKASLPEFTGLRMPVAVADAFFKEMALKDAAGRSFAHPFYWAAFTFTGA